VIMLCSLSVMSNITTNFAKDLTNFHKISLNKKFRCRFDDCPVTVEQ
jgi:hypothetical protein